MKKLKIQEIKVLVIFLIFGCTSCTNRKKELEYLICRDSIQYWDYEFSDDNPKFHAFTFSFSANGDIQRYGFNKITTERFLNTESPYHEDDSIKKWTITKDSILKFMYSSNKLSRISENEDTIYFERTGNKELIRCIRVYGKLNIQTTKKAKLTVIINGDTIKNFSPF